VCFGTRGEGEDRKNKLTKEYAKIFVISCGGVACKNSVTLKNARISLNVHQIKGLFPLLF
jgi:hypothetical protein